MKQLRLKKNGKAPLVAGAFDGESEDLIKKWIKDGGNIGILTGTKSGIVS